MNVNFTQAARDIGTLVAAATHDYRHADPAAVGLNGVPVLAWREAYMTGCKDMANKLSASFPEDVYAEIKKAVEEAWRTEYARLETLALTSQPRGSKAE